MSFIGTAKDLFVQSLQLRADLHAAHIHGPRVPGGLRHHTGALFGFVPSFEHDIAPLILQAAYDPVFLVENLSAHNADHPAGGEYIRNIFNLQDIPASGGPHTCLDTTQAEIILQRPLSCVQ